MQRDLTSKRVLGVLLGEAFQGRVVRRAAGSLLFSSGALAQRRPSAGASSPRSFLSPLVRPPLPRLKDVTDSFAVPFEEDSKDPTIFFLDHDYLEAFYYMHKKVSAKERIVGFYSTSPKLRAADLALDALFRRLPFGTPHPVLVLIDVRPGVEGLPVQAYESVETVAAVRGAARPAVAAA